MYQIDFSKPVHVHFMGIGGISMSGLATILHHNNFTVSGSDSNKSTITDKLSLEGIKIFIGQKASNISDDIDLVVYSAAIHEDNEEYQAAVEKNIPLLTRAMLLGQIMKNYDHSLAISGTHGKTTTTSMITQVLMEAKKDPTVSVGGMLDCIGGNIRIGKSPYFVTEACEYTNSFLSLFPTTSIILNIEAEHLDFFKDLADVRNSFKKFTNLLPEDGNLIINTGIENYEEIAKESKANLITFGFDPKSDYSATDISYDEKGCTNFKLLYKGQFEEVITLKVPGEHNILNALSAIAFLRLMEISYKDIKSGLLEFRGAKRRFEIKGNFKGATIIDDYAHHPTEISATLKAALNYPHKRLIVIFQPHTYSRTKAFLKDFADALSLSDMIILADIYAARETDNLGISSDDIRKLLAQKGKEAYYFKSFEEIEKFIISQSIDGDLLITMGAGNVVKVGEDLLK
ncbi:UDP-N-acetylmuramate--L-alanine ligase [Acetitomaculum ruminis DSM 5522]|uniref:UDP-N-acetylmuramate--L-alanine ligase n=1 Tax=Acetitomaculum ruminis DSM 5522 TaxID=1120918 RepID=A0A1I0WYH8_9FIRM|nr:UDP-N-acetylmuramate--L-alanine ligase [Acetitomaculum ruminis]SFA93799.1 UDP-N-acetylmuramate--L-alanine ligase [Acetitomaculum ruminis DSM 5522]